MWKIGELENSQLLEILEALRIKAEVTRLAMIATLRRIPNGGGAARELVRTQMKDFQKAHWWEHADPEYFDIVEEVCRRGLPDRRTEWPLVAEETIDLNLRGFLERNVVGALRDSINAHGPITTQTANSAAKRVIGVIKAHNHRSKRMKE